MKYLKIINYDTNNGSGFRTTLFVSGCGKVPKCKYCQNKESWDFNKGYDFTQETEDYIINLLSQPLISGFSLIGGEPMDNLEDGKLIKLLKRIRIEFPNISIYCWTGYKYEDIIQKPKVKELLQYIDLLRDGEFDITKKDLTQYLQGSSNQRYINVQESLKQNKVIEYENLK